MWSAASRSEATDNVPIFSRDSDDRQMQCVQDSFGHFIQRQLVKLTILVQISNLHLNVTKIISKSASTNTLHSPPPPSPPPPNKRQLDGPDLL